MNTYYMIDESGDTGYSKKSSRFFIITAISSLDVGLFYKIAKKVHRNKKEKKKSNGLHACFESDQIKYKLINLLKSQKVNCIVVVIDKYKIKVNDPYVHTLIRFAQFISKIDTGSLMYVSIARKDTRKNYNKNIIEMFNFYNVQANFSTPEKEKALQIADFYSWVIFSHLENNHSSYFESLKHQITVI